MKLYSQNRHYKLYHGSMLDMLEVIEPCSIDSIVTDPPYELNFMGKGWDNSGIAFQKETWENCYKALKSGGYLLAFGGSRTFHRIACAIEDAGFEIRDTIMWLYGSGFPKSMDISKSIEAKLLTGSANTQEFKNLDGLKQKTGDWGISRNVLEQGARPSDYTADEHLRTVQVDYKTEEALKWRGWGTALKPSYEPVIVARKPCIGSCTENVLKYGVGALNIDECRVGSEEHSVNINDFSNQYGNKWGNGEPIGKLGEKTVVGRFPANTILTYNDEDFDEVCGGLPITKSNGGKVSMPDFTNIGEMSKENIGSSKLSFGQITEVAKRKETGYVAPCDSGSASRYFYCAKASKRDRDEGLNEFESTDSGTYKFRQDGDFGEVPQKKNIHPTVKPTDLMQYLVRLVTPNGGTVLDPFNGSGSTGKAVMYENKDRNKGYKYIGIELTADYLPIAKARIEYVTKSEKEAEEVVKEEEIGKQMTIFDY